MIPLTINFKIERWKFNSEYGVYVSTLGHFKDRHKRNIPNFIGKQKGYCSIKTERGIVAAHRLVLITWRPIPNRETMTVDHLNHNKRDNSLKNLEWVSREDNLLRAQKDLYNDINIEEENNLIIKLNSIPMTVSQAFSFISYDTSNKNLGGCSKESIKKYIINFAKDNNPKRRKAKHYGYIFERV